VLGLEPELRERGYGVFEGLTGEECGARYPEAWAARGDNRNFEPPGAEPYAAVIARMQRAITRIARAHAADSGSEPHLLVVGHGSSLRMFVETVTGRSEQPMPNLSYHHVYCDDERFVYVPNTSVTPG
jgi:probable phosphoglycerate mutase